MKNLKKKGAIYYLAFGCLLILGHLPSVDASELIRDVAGKIPLSILTFNPSSSLLRRSFENYLKFELKFDPKKMNSDYLNEKLAAIFPKNRSISRFYFRCNQRFYYEKHLKKTTNSLFSYYGKAGVHSFLLYHLIHDNSVHSKL